MIFGKILRARSSLSQEACKEGEMIHISILWKHRCPLLAARWLIAAGIFLILALPVSRCRAQVKFDGIDDDCYLDFTWTEPENAASTLAYYNIYLSVDGGEFSNYDTVSADTYAVPGDSGHTYKIKVAGINSYDEEGLHSPESDEILCLAPSSDTIPPKSTDQLTAEEWQGAVLLTWAPVTLDSLGLPESVSHYIIYRSEAPFFSPQSSDSIAAVATTTYLDEGSGIGSVDHNSYYLITAVDQAGNEGQISNRVAEYDYTIIPNASGYHMFSLILDNGQIVKAKDLGQTVPNCTAVKEWDSQTQSYASLAFKIGETWYGETELHLGYPYYLFVDTSQESTWTIVGGVGEDPVFTLVAPGGNGYNTITVPLSSTISLAKELGESIPHCTAVKSWDPQAQGYVSIAFKVGETWYGEEAIHPGQPYFANVTQGGIWPGGKIADFNPIAFRKRGRN